MKRDHFTRPIQSDRSHHEYGHTKLTRDDDWQMPVWVWALIGAGIAAFLIFQLPGASA